MKSYVVYKDHTCGFEEMPMPKYGEYDALVKLESCGVCTGTDTKIIHGKFKSIDTYPVVLGHEGVGRVIAIGSKVRTFKEGDLVLMPYWSDVPEGYTSGWGTYSEYNIVTDAMAQEADGIIPQPFSYGQRKLPSDFDPVDSSMIITFREVLSTLKQFGLEPNKSLLVFGMGPVGLSFVQFAKFLGIGPVIAMDRHDNKLELAKKVGADYVFDTNKCDIKEAIQSVCPNGIDYVLDAVGYNDLMNIALDCLVDEGKICVYGISSVTNYQLDWSRCAHNWTIQLHQFPSKKAESDAHDQIVHWIRCGILDPKMYISHVFPFGETDKAFQVSANREPALKMVIKF